MTNSAIYKDDSGKFAKLDNCPICDQKVHFEENDVNTVAWAFASSFAPGKMMHEKCATSNQPTERGEYWNGSEMAEV